MNDFFIFKHKTRYSKTVSIANFQHRSQQWTGSKLRQKQDTSIHPYCEGGAQQPHHAHSIFGANHCWDVSSFVILWDHMSVNQLTMRCVYLTPWGIPRVLQQKHNDSWTQSSSPLVSNMWRRIYAITFINSLESLMKRTKGGRRRAKKKKVKEEMMKEAERWEMECV